MKISEGEMTIVTTNEKDSLLISDLNLSGDDAEALLTFLKVAQLRFK